VVQDPYFEWTGLSRFEQGDQRGPDLPQSLVPVGFADRREELEIVVGQIRVATFVELAPHLPHELPRYRHDTMSVRRRDLRGGKNLHDAAERTGITQRIGLLAGDMGAAIQHADDGPGMFEFAQRRMQRPLRSRGITPGDRLLGTTGAAPAEGDKQAVGSPFLTLAKVGRDVVLADNDVRREAMFFTLHAIDDKSLLQNRSPVDSCF
jgi:hypothetical protein